MNRRTLLKGASVLSAGSLLAGCSGGLGPQPGGGLRIEYSGTPTADGPRTVAVTIGNYDPENVFDSGSSPPQWRPEMQFQTLYRLTQGKTLQPDIQVESPGKYRFDVWVESLGRIGTTVEITVEGQLSDTHRINITSDGIEHRRQ